MTVIIFAVYPFLIACTGFSPDAIVGLPADDFQRAYAAGYDVAAAERCGEALDAGLIRYRLVEDAKRRGLTDADADTAGRTFDKTRAEFSRKLQSRPDYCVAEYSVSRETLSLYQKGEFSNAR